MKFINRFEKLDGITKAYFLPNRLHLTVFYDENQKKESIKAKVLSEIYFAGLERSVETLSLYAEGLQEKR